MPPPSIFSQSRRRQIIRACKARRGWTLQPAALEGIEAFLQSTKNNGNDNNNNNDVALDMLFQLLDPHMQGKKTITSEIVQASLGYNEYEDDDDDDDDDNDDNIRLRQPQQRQRRGDAASSRQPLSLVVQQRGRRSGDSHRQNGVGGIYKSTSSSSRRNAAASATGDDNSLTIVSAFDCPKLVYHNLKKNFQVQEKKWSLFGTAEDKVDMLAQRYALIHQRILRHDLFRPSDLGRQLQRNNGTNTHHKLTPIESLLGRRSSGCTVNSSSASAAPLLLLGMLVQLEEGQYYLEDPTGQIPVSFAQLTTTAEQDQDFFVTEHAILLVEGTARDGIFYIHRLGHPLLEHRNVSLRAIQQQVHHPAYCPHMLQRSLLPTHQSSSSANSCSKKNFVVLSDVYMDQPQVLSRLEGLFASYENFSPHRLPLFCLMGNFSSPGGSQQNSGGAGSSNSILEGSMEELATLVMKFPNLAQHAHFVIIPGPRDYDNTSGGALLPMPRPRHSSTSPLTKAIQHVHVGSNPCRIRWEGREMVLFRYDLLQLLQHEQLDFAKAAAASNNNDRMQVDDDNDGEDETTTHSLPHCRLIKTILDQGHLVPIAGVPIYWQYDHALRLYPLPDVLVLGLDARPVSGGDESAGANKSYGTTSGGSGCFDEIYGDCHVLHPGSIAAPSNAASYATVEMKTVAAATKSTTNKKKKHSNRRGRKKTNNNTSDDSSSSSSGSRSEDEDDDGVDTRIMHIGGLSQEE